MVGNLPNFTKLDLLRGLFRINKPKSRSALSKDLELGEGTVRSILDILKRNNLLKSNRKGHYLSAKGRNFLRNVNNILSLKEVQANIIPGKKKIAAHIKIPAKLGKVYELRDTAVKAGADGALILRYAKKLELYGSNAFDYDFSKMENEFDLAKDDLVVVAYSDSYKLAEYGALVSALEASSSLKKLMQKLEDRKSV